MRVHRRHVGYAIAVCSTVLAAAVRFALEPALVQSIPFITFFPAVIFTLWFGGLYPGLLAIVLSAAAAAWMGLTPGPSRMGWLPLVLFFAAGGLIALLIESLHRARRAVEKAAQDLRDRQAQMSGIISSAMDAIITVDEDQRITMFNASAERTFRCKAEDVIGTPLDQFIPERYRTEHRHQVRRFGHSNVTRRSMGRLGFLYGCRADGEEFPIEASISQVEVAGKKLYTVILRDVTDRRKSEEEREELLRREQEARQTAELASRMKDQFLATVSHELRTPLNAILGWTRLLQNGDYKGPNAARALEVIERNARAQAKIIEDILDVSRIVTGKLRLQVRQVDVHTLLRDAIESIRPAASAKHIELQVSVEESAHYMAADPSRLQQVLWNLLSNAIKFTPEGGGVSVTLTRSGGFVRIRVADSGAGIEPDFLPYVFERFRQADSTSTRKHGGLGLGLAIVRHIIELHGGTVHVDSEGLGKGSVFTVQLPMGDEVEQDAGAGAFTEMGAAASLPCSPDIAALRVLIVDDEPDARDMFRTILGHCGAEVQDCGTVSEALEILRTWKPDVLVSDIAMPGEDGHSLIRKVRSLPPEEGGKIPAAALTAYVRIEDRMRVLSEGYQMFVPKPVEPEELIEVINNLAAQRAVPKR